MSARETREDPSSRCAVKEISRQAIAWIVILLVLFVTLSLGATLQKSPTSDESFQLFAGYAYLKWGDYRFNPEHPPFAKLLAALPLLGLKLNDEVVTPEKRDTIQVAGVNGWRLANQWLFSNNAEKILFYARLPMVSLGAILGLLVYCWARELFGLRAALAALAMYVLDPNILAHSAIIHTDIPFALAFFGGTYFLWRTMKEMSWFNWLLTVVFFSLAVVTKFSFTTILPIWVLLGIVTINSPEPLHPDGMGRFIVISGWRQVIWGMFILFSLAACAYLALWASYGFRYVAVHGSKTPLGTVVVPAVWLQPLVAFNAHHHLMPEAWLSGFVYATSTTNRTAYLLGEISDGFWLYFPIAFAIKTPLPILMLLVFSLFACLQRRKFCPKGKFLLLPALSFFLVAVYSRMNIGLRHILVIYPFLYVWLGGSVPALWTSRSRLKRLGVAVIGIWLAISTLNSYPDFLAYFNETVDQRAAHEILVDSNLDWGQDLTGLKKWMDENAVKNIQLAYFGTADPAYYGIDAFYQSGTWSVVFSRPGNGATAPTSRYLAISATHLVGLFFGTKNPYAGFLTRKPIAIVGRSIFIYRIDDL
jgi:4-amino-4-deoxy-L-arabinose transferase-like glycosyltransferase